MERGVGKKRALQKGEMSSTSRVCQRIHRLSPSTHSASYYSTPSIQEQLKYASPSRSFCKHYAKKFEKLEEDYNQFENLLSKYKRTFEQQHQFETHLAERDDENYELQQALSDLQIAFMEERRKTIETTAENNSLQQQIETYKRRLNEEDLRPGSNCQCAEYLERIRALEDRLKEKEEFNQQEIEVYKRDREILIDEMKAREFRDAQEKNALNNRLKQAQELLHGVSQDYLLLQKEGLTLQRNLLQKNSRPASASNNQSAPCRRQTCYSGSKTPAPNTNGFSEKNRLALLKEISGLKTLFEKLDVRRRLQIEGFQNDVRHFHPEKEVPRPSLSSVKHSAVTTKKLSDNVGELKRKILCLEERLKNV